MRVIRQDAIYWWSRQFKVMFNYHLVHFCGYRTLAAFSTSLRKSFLPLTKQQMKHLPYQATNTVLQHLERDQTCLCKQNEPSFVTKCTDRQISALFGKYEIFLVSIAMCITFSISKNISTLEIVLTELFGKRRRGSPLVSGTNQSYLPSTPCLNGTILSWPTW